MKIIVRVTDQYGQQVVRPVCRKAHMFAEIAGTKTLTRQALAKIEALGYEIEVVQDSVKF